MNLKELRIKKELSQKQLSTLSGVSQSGICYIETNNKSPSLKTLEKLAKALDVSIQFLIES